MGQYPCFCGSKKKKKEAVSTDDEYDEESLQNAGASPEATGPQINAVKFSYDELVAATENFNLESFIRQSIVGPMFKGTLATNDQVVAIQQLNPEEDIQNEDEFQQELKMLTEMRHVNLINLIGYCNEGDKRLLVSEFVPSESNLEFHLHARTPETPPLDWKTRIKIATGVARALTFLHHEVLPSLKYTDLRSSNVLLTDSLEPKLADVRRPGPDHHSQGSSSTAVDYARGYHAPEYTANRNATFKTDVYSFGILMLELITGQKPYDEARGERNALLVDWVRPRMADWRFERILDPVLKGKCSMASLEKTMILAWPCIRDEPPLRPRMSQTLKSLESLMSELNLSVQPPSGRGETTGAGAASQPSGGGEPTGAGAGRPPSGRGETAGAGAAGQPSGGGETAGGLQRRGRRQ